MGEGLISSLEQQVFAASIPTPSARQQNKVVCVFGRSEISFRELRVVLLQISLLLLARAI